MSSLIQKTNRSHKGRRMEVRMSMEAQICALSGDQRRVLAFLREQSYDNLQTINRVRSVELVVKMVSAF